MRRSGTSALLVGALTAAIPACGARTGLLDVGADPGGVGPGGADAGPEARCDLQMVGLPVPVRLAGVATTSATVTTVDPGDAASGAQSLLAVQSITTEDESFGHSVNLAVDLRAGREWPSGLTPIHDAVVFGLESHTYGLVARSAGADARIAILYGGDPGGPVQSIFRSMDANSWSPDSISVIEVDGSSPADIVSGAGVSGSPPAYQGTGYVVSWYSSGQGEGSLAKAAIVDEFGAIQLGPFAVTAAGPEPIPGPRFIWTGTTYLAAVTTRECSGASCTPDSVTIGRIDPTAEPPYSALHTISPLQGKGSLLGRPTVAAVGKEFWAAWAEGEGDAPSWVRVARLGADGEMIAQTAYPQASLDTYRISLTAGPGMPPSLTWIADGDPTLADDRIGRSFVITQPLSPESGEPVGEAIEAPVPRAKNAYLTASHTAFPHGLFAMFSSGDEVFLHRLDCGDTLPEHPSKCPICPGAPPADGSPCDAKLRVICRYRSKTPKPYNAVRCEDGAWQHRGPGALPPDDGCPPLEQPTGVCSPGSSCVYGAPDDPSVVDCGCGAGDAWGCQFAKVCE